MSDDDDIFDASTDSEYNNSHEDDDMARLISSNKLHQCILELHFIENVVHRVKMQESTTLHTKAKNGRVSADIANDGLPELPNFLEGLKFMLYGTFTPEDRRCMRRHIIAYSGYVSIASFDGECKKLHKYIYS